MPRLRSLVVLLALALVGCPKSSASSGDEKASKADDDDTTKAKKSKKASTDDDDDDKSEKRKHKKEAADDDDDTAKAKAKKSKGDDDDDDSAKAKTAKKGDDAATAVNADDVKRYPDEKKLDPPVKLKTAAANYEVRVDSIGTSKSVAALPKDAEVTELAERNSHYLVTFANPKNPSELLMGWIFRKAFEAAPDKAAAGAKKCPPGQVVYDSPATGAFCTKKCTKDSDCNKGEGCADGACLAPE